ncbi:9615_t:CDS:2 [Cetraspora pellucida]|uniref:9615_t:CDS:1 n=1 Tax=Cetraspora pellucida TaxID=1433469 RepID=A0ACA9LQW4_9GLOM|nr:9615_t:CDS:2 [Cetraspora pellucida]
MATRLLHAQYFQVDLTFKRVHGKINEFEFNEFDSNHNIILTYARIFTNISTATSYQRMFKAVIETVNELCKQKVQIKHIHNDGWRVILGDLDIAQAKGLALMLVDLDPTKDWETHLKYIFKSCRVHYKRKSKLSNNLKNLMYELLTANKDRVVDIFQEFATSDEDGALEWGNYYMKPWRLASLNYNYSNIAEEDWHSAGENTNAAESAHADANREGTQISLLLAIRKGKRLDERRFAMCKCQDQYNIPKTGHSSGPIAKATKSIKKFEPSKRKKNPPTNKRTSNSNAATANNEELNDLDTEIAKREKLRKLELIDYEFQHQKEMLDIEKRTKLANLRAQELANIEKEKALGINKD